MKRDQLRLRATLRLNGIFAGESDFVKSSYDSLSSQLEAGIELRLPSVMGNDALAEVYWVDDGDFGEVQLDAEVPLADPMSNESDLIDFAGKEFANRVSDFELACHIAQPGGLRVREVSCTVNQKRILAAHRMDVVWIWMAVSECERLGVNPLWTLPVLQVWNWLTRIHDFVENLSDDALWRTVNCLRLALGDIGETDANAKIVWVMIGLESLYGKNTSLSKRVSKARQIKGQVHSFLRSLAHVENEAFAEAIRSLYEVRSRFFHGDLSFPRPHMLDYDTELQEKFYHTMQVSYLGLALLIATIQEFVERDWHSLMFDEYPLDLYIPHTAAD